MREPGFLIGDAERRSLIDDATPLQVITVETQDSTYASKWLITISFEGPDGVAKERGIVFPKGTRERDEVLERLAADSGPMVSASERREAEPIVIWLKMEKSSEGKRFVRIIPGPPPMLSVGA